MTAITAISCSRSQQPAIVLAAVKVRPGSIGQASPAACRPTLTAAARVGVSALRPGRKNGSAGPNQRMQHKDHNQED